MEAGGQVLLQAVPLTRWATRTPVSPLVSRVITIYPPGRIWAGSPELWGGDCGVWDCSVPSLASGSGSVSGAFCSHANIGNYCIQNVVEREPDHVWYS